MSSLKPCVVAVIPALNEAVVIATVVHAIRAAHDGLLVRHVIVCDNGSTDDTAREALRAGAIVVSEPTRGYGAACLAALRVIDDLKLGADIVLFVDGDGSVKACEAAALVQRVVDGADLVIGARAPDLQAARALTWPQRAGNAVACVMIRA